MATRRSMDARAPRTSAVEEPAQARGEYRVEAPKRGVVTTWVSGRLAPSVAEALRFDFAAASVRAHDGGRVLKLVALHDWEGLSGYDGEARAVLAGVLSDGQATYETTHVLLASSLVGMSISVTAALLGKRVRCHQRRDTWEEALAAWPGPPSR